MQKPCSDFWRTGERDHWDKDNRDCTAYTLGLHFPVGSFQKPPKWSPLKLRCVGWVEDQDPLRVPGSTQNCPGQSLGMCQPIPGLLGTPWKQGNSHLVLGLSGRSKCPQFLRKQGPQSPDPAQSAYQADSGIHMVGRLAKGGSSAEDQGKGESRISREGSRRALRPELT